MGTLVAWVLVRYTFPGKRLLDSLVDLPFALPTAVAGIALTTLYAKTGWFGGPLASARDPRRVHAARHRRRANVRRPTVRRAHDSAGARGSRPRARRGSGESGRGPLANVRASLVSVDLAGGTHRIRAGLRARRRRIRLGDLHRRQHADAHRDYAAAHRHEAGRVRLYGRHRDRRRHAGDLVRLAALDQFPAALELQPREAE